MGIPHIRPAHRQSRSDLTPIISIDEVPERLDLDIAPQNLLRLRQVFTTKVYAWENHGISVGSD